jgi:hypothetical protein
MDISVKALEEAIAIRRQIDALEKRLSLILRGSAPAPTGPTAGGYVSPATRTRKKGELTSAKRRKLSQLMKARWAARRKAAGKKTTPARKRGTLSPAGRRKLSELMRARWAARRKAAGFGPGPGRVRLSRS